MTTSFSFHNDLSPMFFGFAGEAYPVKETVNLLNDITIEYLSRLTVEAIGLRNDGITDGSGENTKPPPLTAESVLLVVANEPRKRDKIMDLLEAHDTITKLRDTAVAVRDVIPPQEIAAQARADRKRERKKRARLANRSKIPRPMSTSLPPPPPPSTGMFDTAFGNQPEEEPATAMV